LVIIYLLRKKYELFYRPHGDTFSVPAENVDVPDLAVGDVVSFAYENYARRDLPMNPKIYRIRTDLSWQEVVYSAVKEEKTLMGMQKRGGGVCV
jgi:hypothetical protein